MLSLHTKRCGLLCKSTVGDCINITGDIHFAHVMEWSILSTLNQLKCTMKLTTPIFSDQWSKMIWWWWDDEMSMMRWWDDEMMRWWWWWWGDDGRVVTMVMIDDDGDDWWWWWRWWGGIAWFPGSSLAAVFAAYCPVCNKHCRGGVWERGYAWLIRASRSKCGRGACRRVDCIAGVGVPAWPASPCVWMWHLNVMGTSVVSVALHCLSIGASGLVPKTLGPLVINL